jgi:hypothetical protein
VNRHWPAGRRDRHVWGGRSGDGRGPDQSLRKFMHAFEPAHVSRKKFAGVGVGRFYWQENFPNYGKKSKPEFSFRYSSA